MTHFQAQNTEEEWVTEHGGFLSDLFLGLFALGKITCHIIKTLGQPCGDAHTAKNCGFLPTASKKLRPAANSHVMSHLGGISSISSQALNDYSPTQHLDYNLTRDLEPEL